MEDLVLLGSGFYVWLVLPFLIFVARVLDVGLGTVRVIFISRGFKYLAAFIGFFEVLIWLLAIGQIMKNLSNPVCYIAYGGGFATGTFVGICIADKISLGVVLIRIITKREASALLDSLKLADYGVTSVDGEGAQGPVKVIFTIVPRHKIGNVVKMIKEFNPQAFYSVEDVNFVKSGVFPASTIWSSFALSALFRPFRKVK